MPPDLVDDRFADLHANHRAELNSAAVRAHNRGRFRLLAPNGESPFAPSRPGALRL
jgi:hypothetical protein